MKKIVILTAHLGHGHLSAAKAIKQAIEHLYDKEYDVEIVDLLQLISPAIKGLTQKSYESFARHAPIFCDFFIDSWDKPWKIKLLNQLNYPLALRKVKKFINEKKPVIMISTFPVWDYLVHKMIQNYDPQIKFVSVITDSIFINNAWIMGNADIQIVPNRDTADAIIKLGFNPKKIHNLGFPVRLDFLKPLDKKRFLEEHDLNPENFTILFLPTSQKPKNNIKFMDELIKNFPHCNIIAIRGRDIKVKNEFDDYGNHDNVKIIGWTDRMPDFIKAADVVLTKAGGATVMECTAAETPMIITSTIARHERGNAELVKRYKLGIVENKRKPQITKSILAIQKSYKMYKKNLKKISNPGAALTIAKELIKSIH